LPPAVLGIDTGGTFTDFVAITDGRLIVHKLPSTPADPSLAAAEGAAHFDLPTDATVAHGSTVATNALLERKGARTVLLTTEGFEDVLQIGRQARSRLYDLEYQPPTPLVPAELRLGVPERVDAQGNAIAVPAAAAIAALAERVAALDVEAAAVCLLYSFLNPAHEELIREAIQRAAPHLFVSLSSDVLPEFREFERTSTVVVNAYVGPLMSRYLDRLRERLDRPLRVMQSSGGAITVELARTQPVRTILSGPAGGVIGATYVASTAGDGGFDNVMTFDMGGTSTDVALCPGRIQIATNHEVDGMPIGVPGIDIHTVGAGGGSIAYVDAGGALRVGPESAGAVPGPACYGTGDQATVTDANLLLGRMVAERFLGGRMAIDGARAEAAVARVAAALPAGSAPVLGGPQAPSSAQAPSNENVRTALGIVRVANAVMERALRTVSLERGFDPREFTLVAFGGAGPQHACELAASLSIQRVLVPRHPGVLSALGVAIADVAKDFSRTVMLRDASGFEGLDPAFVELEQRAVADMTSEGFERSALVLTRSLDVRYRGQSFELPVDWPAGGGYGPIAAAFNVEHAARFGYADERAGVEIVNVRVRAVVPAERPELPSEPLTPGTPDPAGRVSLWFDDGEHDGAVYDRESLRAGDAFDGPSLIAQMDATTVVPPGWRAQVDGHHNLVLTPAAAEGVRS
jgi:N-methylhydantoinase A